MRAWIAVAAVIVAALAGAAPAQEGMAMQTGSEVPDFRINDQAGRGVRLSEFRGKKWVVLAFFPKSMTPG